MTSSFSEIYVTASIPETGNMTTNFPENGSMTPCFPEIGNTTTSFPETGNIITSFTEIGNVTTTFLYATDESTSSNNESVTSPGITYGCKVYMIVTAGATLCGLTLLSTVGNIMIFITWVKVGLKKSFNSSIILMLFLAVFDFISQVPIVFIFSLPYLAYFTGILPDYYCFIFPHLQIYLWPFSCMGNFSTVWVTTLITVHRFSVLCKPFSKGTQLMTSVRNTFLQAVAVATTAIVYNIPRFFEDDIIELELSTGGVCLYNVPSDLRQSSEYQFYYMTIGHLVLLYCGPLLLCTILTIKILQLLSKAKTERKGMISASQNSPIKEFTITTTLLTVVVIFISCQVPNAMFRIWLAFHPEARLYCGSPLFYINPLASILQSVNSSVNLFVYLRGSSDFRCMFKSMCSKGSEETPNASFPIGSIVTRRNTVDS